jgi:hypothetical protein
MRRTSIQRVMRGNNPACRMEVRPTDGPSSGTSGDHPRAEFYSVDPAEKRRQRVAPAESVLRDGDEYWVTFALYIPADFPTNHRWATLFQRKFDDREANRNYPQNYLSWFTLNVHGTALDVTIPGNRTDVDQTIARLSGVVGRWTQFMGHERLSSGSNGLAEFYVDGKQMMSVPSPKQTVRAGDINFHFQYGYYRANEPARGETHGPGVGVVEYTPMLTKMGNSSGTVPTLP